METSKVVSDKEKPQSKKIVLTADEKSRLVDFFAVLIEVDRKSKGKSKENEETN